MCAGGGPTGFDVLIFTSGLSFAEPRALDCKRRKVCHNSFLLAVIIFMGEKENKNENYFCDPSDTYYG